MQISIQIQRPQSLSKLNLFVEGEGEQNRNWQINDFPFISDVCSLCVRSVVGGINPFEYT